MNLNPGWKTLFLGAASALALAACSGDSGEEPASRCSVSDNGDGTTTISCEDGDSVTVGAPAEDQQCTVSEADGNKVITCPDGTSAMITPDTDTDTSCSIADGDAEGVKVITCDDGTSATITPDTDTDTSCAITEADGVKTITCADGTTATIEPPAPPNALTVRGTIEPGGELTLAHNLADVSLSANYIEDGQVHDISMFGHLHSPVVGTPARDFMSGDTTLSNVRAHVLSDGNILLEKYSGFLIVQPDATEVKAFEELTDANGSTCEVDITLLASGGFLVVQANDCSGGDPTQRVRRFDNSGADIGFNNGAQTEALFSLPMNDVANGLDINYTEPAICAWADGSFIVTFVGEFYDSVNGTYDGVMRMMGGDANGTATGLVAGLTLDDNYFENDLVLRCLDDGNIFFMTEYEDANDNDRIRGQVYSPAGVLVSEADLGGTYIGDPQDIAVAPNGNFIIGYELGGPDAAAFAVFDGSGALIAGPTTITGHEPDDISVGVFPDGDFIYTIVEDESSAGLMWNIKNDGTLMHTMPIFFGNGYEPDYRMGIATGTNPNEVIMFYDVYSDPNSYSPTISKNILVLEETSESEARVVNMTQYPVEVVIEAIGNAQ